MSATMYRPGTEVVVTDQPGPISGPTDTDAWFVTGITEKGPVGEAVLLRSLSEFDDVYGARLPTSPLRDCVETFLREGGSRCFVSRVASATAAVATEDFTGAAAAPSLTVNAASPGAWGNGLSVAVALVAGGGFTLEVSDASGVLQTSTTLADPVAAVTWSQFSPWIRVEAAGTAAPSAAAATPLAGGSDGATITEDEWTAALDAFRASLGPGQVSAPGRTVAASHQAVGAHALENNRVALLDPPDTADVASLQAAVSSARTSMMQDARCGMYAPWATIAGLASGTTRTVPWSAIQAGIFARNEQGGIGAGQPAAGSTFGVSRTALGLTAIFTDRDRDTLTRAGMNTARGDLGVIESYGSRTIVNAAQHPQWRELAQVRLIMAITAQAEAVAERHLFRLIDGRGHELSAFNGELVAMLIPYWTDGSLYGDSANDAFRVDTGEAVNTPATIADGQLRAVIGVRCSHMAELVFIEIVKVETTQTV